MKVIKLTIYPEHNFLGNLEELAEEIEFDIEQQFDSEISHVLHELVEVEEDEPKEGS